MLTNLLLLVMTVSASWAVRGEHRVHNIILYPEKYSRCQTTRIQQVVASPGYEPVTIFNNVCVGWCYSYSIPSTQPAEPGEVIGPYCDSCQPIETKCYHVVLNADSETSESSPTFQKRIQFIKKCSCMTCEKIQHDDCEITHQTTMELPLELYANQTQEPPPIGGNKTQEEVPELLHLPNQKPPLINFDISGFDHNDQKFELNTKLINLLKNIQNGGEINYDRNQLKELLKIIEGSDNELSDKNLMEFVNFVNIHNNEDLEIDLGKLKEVLISFQKHQFLEKHRDFGLVQNKKNNLKIEQDFKKYHLPENFGLEESQLKHKHHVGDEIHVGLNVGHLIKGPHDSLVLAPDLNVEEKLNIDSDVLKPNHDGVVIEYESPRKSNGILTD